MSNVIQFNDDQAIEDGKVLAYRMQEIQSLLNSPTNMVFLLQ